MPRSRYAQLTNADDLRWTRFPSTAQPGSVTLLGRMTAPRLALLLALLLPLTARADGWGEAYTLPNGLHVILNSDQRFPTVTVFVRYHVGARQEPVGRSGMAHLLEHLTFKVPRPVSQGGTFASQFTLTSRNGSTY